MHERVGACTAQICIMYLMRPIACSAIAAFNHTATCGPPEQTLHTKVGLSQTHGATAPPPNPAYSCPALTAAPGALLLKRDDSSVSALAGEYRNTASAVSSVVSTGGDSEHVAFVDIDADGG